MTKRRLTSLAVVALILAIAATGQCANLLGNWSFEDIHNPVPFDKLPSGQFPTLSTWYSEAANADNLFDGVFDSTWNNPPDVAGWPSNFGAFEGSYYLGKYRKPGGAPGQLNGAVYQMAPAAMGTTYYASLWMTGYDPHGWGAGIRIGIDPTGAVNETTQQPDWGSSNIVWYPEPTLEGTPKWMYAKRGWQKMQVNAAASPVSTTDPRITVWVMYEMPPNNQAAPQLLQVDSISLSDTADALFIQELDVLGVTYSVSGNTADYKVTWRVTNGLNDVNATCVFKLNGMTQSAPLRDAAGVYSETLSGLTLNGSYTFSIEATAQSFDKAVYNGSFKAYPVLDLTNAVVSNLTPTSAVISWDTRDKVSLTTPVATTGVVECGDYYSISATDTPGPNPTLKSHHEVTLTGLMPNTNYKYRTISERPEGSTNPGPYGKTIKNKAGLFTEYKFTTPGSGFWNGDFELTYADPTYRDDPTPGWIKFNDLNGGSLTWYFNGEWGIPSASGSRYMLQPSNFGGAPQGGMYQQFATTPGELLAFSSAVWGESFSPDGITGVGTPHRFGESNVKVGIDPTGGTNPSAATIVWTADRETLDWQRYVNENLVHNGWQTAQIATYAQSTQATIFLKADAVWGNNWVMCGFDNVTKLSGLTAVTSVAAAKALDNDSAISLSGDVVVTRIVGYSDGLLYAGENKAEPYFYIQDEEGTAGIKVTLAPGTAWPDGIAVGQKVAIEGMITHGTFFNTVMNRNEDQLERLNKPSGERVIKAIKITPGVMGTVPAAVGMSNKALCGGSSSDHWFTNPGAPNGVGPNNVGRIVRVWGKVVDAGLKGDTRFPGHYYMVIDDGSGAERYGSTPVNPMSGVYIDCGPMGNARDFSGQIGKYAAVTGISAIIPDFDWDDPSATEAGTEALKNVRTIKPLTFEAPNIIFMDVP